jgi:hypothetical protein
LVLILPLRIVPEFAGVVGGVDFLLTAVLGLDHLDVDVVGDGDVVGLPLEGLELGLLGGLWRVPEVLGRVGLRPGGGVRLVVRLMGDFESAQHFGRYMIYIGVVIPYMLIEDAVIG